MENAMKISEALKKIPSPNQKSAPEKLREIATSFMQVQSSFTFTPTKDWEKGGIVLKKGHTYRSIPSQSKGSGNLYRLLPYYNEETGEFDTASLTLAPELVGASRAAFACAGWGRVVTSAIMEEVENMTQKAGYLPVGSYTYPEDLASFDTLSPLHICAGNGKEVMFSSYARLKVADGIQNGKDVYFVSRPAEVDEGGDESRSRIYFFSQSGKMTEESLSFAQLFEQGFLPFTFGEFLGTCPVKWVGIEQDFAISCFNLKQLEEVAVTATFPISHIFVTVNTNDFNNSKELYRDAYYPATHGQVRVEMNKILKFEELAPFCESGTLSLELHFHLIGGQVIKSYRGFKGTLCPGKPTTNPEADHLIDALNKIPVATPDMTEDELRQICVDFFRLQLSFPWITKEDMRHPGTHYPRKAGRVYGGIPYVNIGSGNAYRWAEYYNNDTCEMDLTPFIENVKLFGNACSGSSCWAWSRVVNSALLSWTTEMTQANGYIPVGPYTYDPTVKVFSHALSDDPDRFTCENICNTNGEQAIFESYAQMKPADGLVCPGHVRMNVSYPVVVRKEDGSIDGEKSYLFYCDQVLYTAHHNHTRIQKDGTHYTVQGGIDFQDSFKHLFDIHYLPFTFAELIGKKKVDLGEAHLDITGKSVTEEALRGATLTGSYNVSDVFITVRDEVGKDVLSLIGRSQFHYLNTYALKDCFGEGALAPFADGKHTVQILCQLSNGEKKEAFCGVLVKG